jgi:transposase InsO family protein
VVYLFPVRNEPSVPYGMKKAPFFMLFVNPGRCGFQEMVFPLISLFPKHRLSLPSPVRVPAGSGIHEEVQSRGRPWLQKIGVKESFIEPGSPWENGYIESFNGKMRDEFLNGELLDTLYEVEILAERWRIQYNTFSPHSGRNYLPPAPASYEFWEQVKPVNRFV